MGAQSVDPCPARLLPPRGDRDGDVADEQRAPRARLAPGGGARDIGSIEDRTWFCQGAALSHHCSALLFALTAHRA